MKRKAGSFILFLLKVVLFFAILAVFYIAQFEFYPDTQFYFWGNILTLLLYSAFLYLASRVYNGFHFGSSSLQEIIISWVMCLIIINVLQYFILSLFVERLISVRGFLLIIAFQVLLVIPVSIMINAVYYRLNPAHNTIIIYGSRKSLHLCQMMITRQQRKFKVLGTVSQHEPTGVLLDSINNAQAVFFLDVDEAKQEGLLEYCYLNDKHTYVLPTFTRILFYTAGTIWLSNTPVFSLKKPEPDTGTLMIKRLMDILISLFGIILTSPIMLIIWLVVRIYDNHPAIYKQTRVTKGRREFKIYKFRSMVSNAEDDGVPRLTSKEDTRITPFGRFIRRTRLDELPQLFNVLFGAMSLVGPRPERPEIAKMYEENYPNFAFRTKVKAGITGFAQIFGRYNTAPEEKLFLDIMYIETFSILQDIKLMLQTVNVLFKPISTEGIDDNSITAMK